MTWWKAISLPTRIRLDETVPHSGPVMTIVHVDPMAARHRAVRDRDDEPRLVHAQPVPISGNVPSGP